MEIGSEVSRFKSNLFSCTRRSVSLCNSQTGLQRKRLVSEHSQLVYIPYKWASHTSSNVYRHTPQITSWHFLICLIGCPAVGPYFKMTPFWPVSDLYSHLTSSNACIGLPLLILAATFAVSATLQSKTATFIMTCKNKGTHIVRF